MSRITKTESRQSRRAARRGAYLLFSLLLAAAVGLVVLLDTLATR